ncbi:GyrI-like domain-containing protein [Paenibacillus sp. Z3-2]
MVETLLKDTKEQMIIPKLQQSFNERKNEVPDPIGLPVTYGVFIDPPNYKPDTDLFKWIAGVEVRQDQSSTGDLVSYDIPAGLYAAYEYKGDIDQAGEAYGILFDWINQSEYELSGSYGFELYNGLYFGLERRTADFKLHFPIRKG